MKTLEQIQEENRGLIKNIIKKDCDCNDGKVWSDDLGWENCDFCYSKCFNLSGVLLSISKYIEKLNYEEFIQLDNLFDGIAIFQITQGEGALEFQWDLSELNLEHQSDKTQMIINKILKNYD